MKVLVVDDDYAVLDAMKDILEDEGYEVSVAANGLEALKELSRGAPPNVILLDLMMPVMNGWEFREAQSRNEKISDIPVVILTADGRADVKAETLGAAGYLRKPIQVDRLLGMLEQFEC